MAIKITSDVFKILRITVSAPLHTNTHLQNTVFLSLTSGSVLLGSKEKQSDFGSLWRSRFDVKVAGFTTFPV